MADFALTYDDYVQGHPGDATGGSEGGQGTSSLISQDQWNNMSDSQKWSEVENGIILTPADPRYADLAKQLGVTNGRQIVGGPMDKSTQLDSTYLVDPGRVVKQAGGFFTPDENLTPRAQASTGVPDWFWPVAFLAGVAGGTALGGVAAGSAGAVPGASTALETGGIVTAGDIAAGTSAGLSTGAAGAAGAAGVEGAAAVPGAAGDESAGLSMTPPGSAPPVDAPPPVDESAGLNMTPPGSSPPPVDESAGLNMNPAGTPTATPDLPPGTQAPAPVSEAPPPAGTQPPAGVTDVSTPAPNGLINSASNGWQSISDWYSHLSPASRYILGLGVSQGARGALGAVSQHEAHQAAVDAENRHRQDVIRQGQVPVLPPGTFTYKPPGG